MQIEELTVALPQRIEETGIRRTILEDLALKILYLNGEMTLPEMSHKMCLGLGVIEQIFEFFRKEQLCQVKGMTAGAHRIAASDQGKARAAGLMTLSQYAGPAPVSLEDYCARVRAQSVQSTPVQPKDLEDSFAALVLEEHILERLGAAVVSGTSIFLYGPPGTGKTTIACIIPEIYKDAAWVPHAVEVDGQIITVFDPGVHRSSPLPAPEEYDRRWVLCRRPQVIAGGELTMEMLDLQYSDASRFYTAPLQMKANNGVLVIDDFGRQRVKPEELLNRWMTPLDRRMDFLSMPGGRKFDIPFDLFVVFSTNLDPRQLADDAFLRRIPNKVKISAATPENFKQILTNECLGHGISWDADVPDRLTAFITGEMKQPLSQCLPRDLVRQIQWSAKYTGGEPRLTWEGAEEACRKYFLPPES